MPPRHPFAGERYLIYQPQFGLSNQLIALRNAAAWAAVLNRTLVIPHILSHTTEKEYTGHSAPRRSMSDFANAFEGHRASRAVAPLRVMDMQTYIQLGLKPPRLIHLESRTKLNLVSVRDDYFRALAEQGTPVVSDDPPVHVFMQDLLPAQILERFDGCFQNHQVLAFSSFFGMWNGKPGSFHSGWTIPSLGNINGFRWLDTVVLPALLKPSPQLRVVVEKAVASILAQASSKQSGQGPYRREGETAFRRFGVAIVNSSAVGSSPADIHAFRNMRAYETQPKEEGDARSNIPVLACVHVRRGDFEIDCPKYEAEARRRDGRRWVKAHVGDGYSCLQDPRDIDLNLRALFGEDRSGPERRARRIAIYAAVENPEWIRHPTLRHWNLSHLEQHINRANAQELRLPWDLAAPLIDQLVCAHSRYFILNIFSTFSQIMMAHIGLANGKVIGWVRNLSRRQQRQLGIEVAYWRTHSFLSSYHNASPTADDD